jgi:hypothetical protein
VGAISCGSDPWAALDDSQGGGLGAGRPPPPTSRRAPLGACDSRPVSLGCLGSTPAHSIVGVLHMHMHPDGPPAAIRPRPRAAPSALPAPRPRARIGTSGTRRALSWRLSSPTPLAPPTATQLAPTPTCPKARGVRVCALLRWGPGDIIRRHARRPTYPKSTVPPLSLPHHPYLSAIRLDPTPRRSPRLPPPPWPAPRARAHTTQSGGATHIVVVSIAGIWGLDVLC